MKKFRFLDGGRDVRILGHSGSGIIFLKKFMFNLDFFIFLIIKISMTRQHLTVLSKKLME